jgi:hypothetical protein
MNSATRGKLSTIDFVFSIMNEPARPFDFALVFHLKDTPSVQGLQLGASSARNLYPTTGSYLARKEWIRAVESQGEPIQVSSDSGAIEKFLDQPLDPSRQQPVQQLLVLPDEGNGNRTKLVTRFHHAAADGLSATLWLAHQLRVAYSQESPTVRSAPFLNLVLKTHPSGVRRSRFSFAGPSDRLWAQHSSPSPLRRWLTVSVPTADIRKRCVRIGGFSYNDLLATCALETFRRWNLRHQANQEQRTGLWLPVNIRRRPSSGFGNGTSRIRVYARYAPTASCIEKCQEIHRQISWSIEHGEWNVPSDPALTRLPAWTVGPLLRRYLNRGKIDMTTGVFSHVERLTAYDNEVFRKVEKIESIGQLHPRHCLAINGATHCGQTWLTFTYDPSMLTQEDVLQIVELYQEEFRSARSELI